MCTNTPISQPMMNMEVGFEKKVYFWPALLGVGVKFLKWNPALYKHQKNTTK